MLGQQWIDGWSGLEGASPKPRGFLRSAQSSPGHPIHQGTTDRPLVQSLATIDTNGNRVSRVSDALGDDSSKSTPWLPFWIFFLLDSVKHNVQNAPSWIFPK